MLLDAINYTGNPRFIFINDQVYEIVFKRYLILTKILFDFTRMHQKV